MAELDSSDFEQLPMEDRVGIEILVYAGINEDFYEQTEKDKEYLMGFNKKTKESMIHKQYLDFVLGIVLEHEPDIRDSRNRFYLNVSKLESEILTQ